MGHDCAYKIYPEGSDMPNWDDEGLGGFENVDVSRRNSVLCNGQYTKICLKNEINSIASSLSDNFDDLDDIVEALKVYASILGEMNETDIVRIVYE